MAKVIDYLHDDTGDLEIYNGDFKKGDAGGFHQKSLLATSKGGNKQNPTIGVGLNSFLLDSIDDDELRHIINEEFERDGMKIQQLNVLGSQIEIEAEYK